jgi:membrane-associated phospholipid phosphatase
MLMTLKTGRYPVVVVVVVAAAMLAAGTTARAQATVDRRAACGTDRSTRQVLTGTVSDFRRLPSAGTAGILALGGAAALGAHAIDRNVNNSVSSGNSGPFRAGATIGGTPLELGAAFTTYAIGRSLKKPCIAALGGDLVQAQLMAEVLTFGLKQATRRARPEGSGFSFPSGHTTMAFASATVLQRHFGWKAGVPAYAVATYVAASRVEMKRHYLSDVAFGAALGIVAGRTIGVGHGRQLMLTPSASPHGAAAMFTLMDRK